MHSHLTPSHLQTLVLCTMPLESQSSNLMVFVCVNNGTLVKSTLQLLSMMKVTSGKEISGRRKKWKVSMPSTKLSSRALTLTSSHSESPTE